MVGCTMLKVPDVPFTLTLALWVWLIDATATPEPAWTVWVSLGPPVVGVPIELVTATWD